MAIQPTTKRAAASSSYAQTAPLVNLPVELIQRVLGHVDDIRAILACGQTCKVWNILMQQDPKAYQCFWKCLVERDFSGQATEGKIDDFQEVYKKHFGLCSNLVRGVYKSCTLEGHVSTVTSLLLAEGKLISGSMDNTIKTWDLKTNACLRTLYPSARARDMSQYVTCLTLAEGNLFSGTSDKVIKIWDLKTNTCLHVLQGHTDWVTSLIFFEGMLISGSADNTIRIWDLKTNTCLHSLQEHTDAVRSLIVVEGKLISCSWDKTIKIWDLKANACLHTLEGHKDGITSLLFVEGKLISGSADNTIKIWDLQTNKCVKTLEGHADWVKSLAVAEGMLFSGSDDGAIKIWDLQSNACLRTIQATENWIAKILFNEGKLISGFSNSMTKIKIWDFNPEYTVPLTVRFDTGYGNSLVLCGEGGGLSWNPSEGKPLKCEAKNCWTTAIPHGAKEFKLVWKKKDGFFVWENGPNRKIVSSSPINIEQIKFKKGK